MAISSLDDYIGSVKQIIPYTKTVARTSVATTWFGIHDLAGNPGAATLNVGNTASGIVPTDATAGFPAINFSTGLGYLANVDFANTVSSRIALFDVLFAAGAYAYNAATTLSSPPSYSSRVPGGTDFHGLQIWAEAVGAGTLVQSVTVTYTDQDGNTGQTTGAVAASAATKIGQMWLLPLASGNSGVTALESITGTVASAGTFNVYVLRPLWNGRVIVANWGDCHGLDRVGLPQIWSTSALMATVSADSTSTGLPDLQLQIASS